MMTDLPIIQSPGYYDDDDVSDTIDSAEIRRELSQIRHNIRDVREELREVLAPTSSEQHVSMTIVQLPERGIRGWLAHLKRKAAGERALKQLQGVLF